MPIYRILFQPKTAKNVEFALLLHDPLEPQWNKMKIFYAPLALYLKT